MAAPMCDIHHTKALTFNFPYNVEPVVPSKPIHLEDMSRGRVLETGVTPLTRGYRDTPTSPTVCRFRIAWNNIFPWATYRQEAFEYMNSLTPQELGAVVDPNHTVSSHSDYLSGLPPPTSERELTIPAHIFFWGPHNLAAKPVAAAHQHANIAPYAPSTFRGVVGDPDYVFKDANDRVVGFIELKTFWSVDARQIDEVLGGACFGGAYHAGRLAVQQLYGYLVRNALVYGVLSTVNGFVFMFRSDGGKLSMTRLLPCNAVNPFDPTMLQGLYMFSARSVGAPLVPETDGNGNAVELEFSHPKYPAMEHTARIPPPAPPPRRSGRNSPSKQGRQYTMVANPDPPKIIFEPWKPENQLGPKTFLVQLVPGDTVVAKVWDGWKQKSKDRDIEAEMLLKLQPLWGKQIPTLIGTGEIDFLWTVLIERIQGRQVSAENMNRTVARNIIGAFREIHKLGVVHGDVRQQNILVREDDSVVIIDFERSMFEQVKDMDIELENDMVDDLLTELWGNECPGVGLSEMNREEADKCLKISPSDTSDIEENES